MGRGAGTRCKHPLGDGLTDHQNFTQWKGTTSTVPGAAVAGEQSEYTNTKCSVKGPSTARKTAALGSTFSILQTRSFNKRKRVHDNIMSGTQTQKDSEIPEYLGISYCRRKKKNRKILFALSLDDYYCVEGPLPK